MATWWYVTKKELNPSAEKNWLPYQNLDILANIIQLRHPRNVTGCPINAGWTTSLNSLTLVFFRIERGNQYPWIFLGKIYKSNPSSDLSTINVESSKYFDQESQFYIILE